MEQKCNEVEIIAKMNIQNIYRLRYGYFVATTPIIVLRNAVLRVKDFLEAIEYYIHIIENEFNITENRYGETISVLRSLQLALTNRQLPKPTKESLRIAMDVLSEVNNHKHNKKMSLCIIALKEIMEY